MRQSLAASTVLLCCLCLLAGCARKSGEGPTPPPGSEPSPEQGKGAGPGSMSGGETAVYLIDPENGCLALVKTEINADGREGRIRGIVKALVSAEETAERIRPLPDGATLANVSVEAGTATLDFEEDFAAPGFWAGSSLEQLRVLALVNSVTELKDVQRVQLLVAGEKVDSLGGHIGLEEPLVRDESLICID